MIKGFLEGLASYIKAIDTANKYKLWKYLWVPGIAGVLIAILIIWLGLRFANPFADWLLSMYPWDWGRSILEWTAPWITALTFLATGFMLYKYLVLIVSFPFMSFISQKIEKEKYGDIHNDPNVSPHYQFVKDMIRGAGISFYLLLGELGWTLLLLIASLIPGVALFSGIGIFLIQAYYAGAGNMDYTLERYYGIQDSRRWMSKESGLAMGNGTGFLFILAIPVLGLFVAPVLGTIAMTLPVLERLEKEVL
ncbi:MAG: EI24 domain-containing protein [Saprospiraceae bacterium]|nr:EI24 domain-containing protein [Saprospiraceae bacterium]